ncbi:MAG: DUF3267 domain-containing protein [Lachnospiraceae bacterium]|nr:DUF3267 domain-containing protein [Lachnospiraceae bacterium]
MRILKNANYDYASYDVSETNGYTKWYDWNIVKKHIRIIYIIITIVLVIVAFSYRQLLRDMADIPTLIFIILGGIVFWLLIITPIHEILHLIPLSKGMLDNKCVITVGHGTVSAIYNGYINLPQHLISLILPFAVFLVLLGLGAIFTTGVIKIVFLYLLILSFFGSYTDIYMFFYSMKHIGKNDIIFGLYKKKFDKSQFVGNREI